MKKAKDIGLEHISKLNISSAREARGIYNEFRKKYGKSRASKIMDGIYEAAKNGGQDALYEKKNEDYDIAMTFSGGYDADIIRRTCNWINEHKEMFGDEILEVGCDCGFMTTFLGTLFPEKHITSIDRCAKGIEIAKKNVEKFGLTNITFIVSDLDNLEKHQYDTVFSMRTMQENGRSDEPENSANELLDQADIYAQEKSDYASLLAAFVKNDGKLISIERLGRNALFLAWLHVLSNSGLRFDLNSYAEIVCKELDDINTFEAMVFSKEDTSEDDVFMNFMECCGSCIDMSLPEYLGWDAKILYVYKGGDLIRGYEIRDTKTNALNRVALKTHRFDDTGLLMYQNNNGNVRLGFFDISQKDDFVKQIEDGIEEIWKIEYMKVRQMTE